MSEARKGSAKGSADSFLSNEVNSMRTNDLSYKDSQIKNWIAKNNFLAPFAEVIGGIKGYIGGFLTAGVKYIPNFVASTVALTSKKKNVANVAAGVLGVLEGFNFFRNTSGIDQKNDYLKM
jgi:hypothetical protein